jgi:aryl-alcohol dehydrogenase-like predicted oxidoreductase
MGLGCASFSGYYGDTDVVTAEDAKRLIDRARQGGITIMDTAAMYGRSEELVGEAIKGRQQGLRIATKFGVLVDSHGKPAGTDASPAAAIRSCDESLLKLGIAVIDIYYLHRLDRKVPIEETVGAMAQLVHAGKVRYLGLCEVSPKRCAAPTRSIRLRHSSPNIPFGAATSSTRFYRPAASSGSALWPIAHWEGGF